MKRTGWIERCKPQLCKGLGGIGYSKGFRLDEELQGSFM